VIFAHEGMGGKGQEAMLIIIVVIYYYYVKYIYESNFTKNHQDSLYNM